MGRELGYSGAELQTFVKEEKAEIRQREEKEREREEREKEREREREREEKEREREEREKEREREREREEKEREREREREEKEREREEKEREREERRLKREAEEQERQAQLQLAKINAEIEISRVNKSTTKSASHEFLSKVPKMAPFSESKGDKVLILLPQNGNNLFMRYQGPYSIQKVANDNNYVCQIGKKLKTYHANLLKKFEERQPLPPHATILPHAAVSFIKEDNDDLKKHLYRSQYCKYPTCPNRLLYSPTLQIKH